MMFSSKMLFAVAFLFGAQSALFGCTDGAACDPDMELDRNYCVMTPDDSGGSAGGESPSSGPEPEEPSEVFGMTCTLENVADVCGSDAPDCGIQPGGSEGVCTVFGCNSAPEEVVCPIGWSCFSIADACLED